MAVSLEQFIDRVVESGLMSRAEVQAVIDAAPTDYPVEEAQQLARLLFKRSKLTAYQVQQVYAGKGKSLTLGNYVVQDMLGQGGMGMVLKAEHKLMERVVALKVLSPNVTKTPEALARFQREVKAAAKLDHPNIVAAHDADEDERTHFLVMQYVDGSDLAAIVRKQGPLSVDLAVSYILQAARGLEYAHGRGVVHRDIKPANLLLDSSGTVKILDMGLARLESLSAEQSHDSDQLTGTGQIMGTVDYMAPEQAIDTRAADARADVYALGITLWYLLTGRRVYDGPSVMARLLAHRETPIPSLQAACPGASPQLDAIFAHMVAKAPEDRYQTMSELIADLERWQSSPDASPLHAGTRRDEKLADAFDGDLPRAEEAPGSTKVKKKKLKMAQALEETVASRENHADTDPDTNLALAGLLAAASSPATPSTRLKTRPPGRKNLAVWLFTGGGVVLVPLLAAVIYFMQPGDGTLRVEIDAPDIEVAVKGTPIVFKQDDKRKLPLSPGDHTLVVRRGGVQFETQNVKLHRGDEVTVRVEMRFNSVQVWQGQRLIGQQQLPTSVAQAPTPKPSSTETPGSVQPNDLPPSSADPVVETTPTVDDSKPFPLPADAPAAAIAPYDAGQAKAHQQAWAEYLGVPLEKEIVVGQDLDGNDVKLTMVFVPPGGFLMGSTDAERAELLQAATAAGDAPAVEHIPDEGPLHRAWITRPFYLGKYEVTQAQWQAMMGSNPAQFKDSPAHPIENVRWVDIQPFLTKLNASAAADGLQFKLPTEAQWEYACRAGTTTYWHRDNREESLALCGWFKANSEGKTHPVGQARPNPLELYDLYGNVAEWCADWYAGDGYGSALAYDPSGASAGSHRVLRGGSWARDARGCRSANRDEGDPTIPSEEVGFRLAAALPRDVIWARFRLVASKAERDHQAKIVYAEFRQRFVSALASRDYSEATKTVHQAKEDDLLADYSKELAQDHADVDRLRNLLAAVEQTLARLEPGAKITVRGIGGQTFVRYDAEQRAVITRSGPTERRTSIAELLARDIEEFAGEPADADKAERALSLGIFHTVDATGKGEQAQKLLAEAAAAGQDVDRWIAALAKRTEDDAAKELAAKEEENRERKEREAKKLAARLAAAKTLRERQEAWAAHLGQPVEEDVPLGGDQKLTMVLIPAGEFMMGSTEKEQSRFVEEARIDNDDYSTGRIPTEGPQHLVRITKPFRLSRYEVTRGQFRRFVAERDYKTEAEVDGVGGVGLIDRAWARDPRFDWNSELGFSQTDDHPVVNVTWNDAMAFCNWLTETRGGGAKFVLPTEAQWEYACRAGTTTPWYSGGDARSLKACAWFGDSATPPHPVGRLRRNEFGLFDMHGNVQEWCADWFAADYYAHSPEDDPTGPASGKSHILRGGTWNYSSILARSAMRGSGSPSERDVFIGFRVASVAADE